MVQKKGLWFILPLKEGYKVIMLIQGRNSSSDDQKCDFEEALFVKTWKECCHI